MINIFKTVIEFFKNLFRKKQPKLLPDKGLIIQIPNKAHLWKKDIESYDKNKYGDKQDSYYPWMVYGKKKDKHRVQWFWSKEDIKGEDYVDIKDVRDYNDLKKVEDVVKSVAIDLGQEHSKQDLKKAIKSIVNLSEKLEKLEKLNKYKKEN